MITEVFIILYTLIFRQITPTDNSDIVSQSLAVKETNKQSTFVCRTSHVVKTKSGMLKTIRERRE